MTHGDDLLSRRGIYGEAFAAGWQDNNSGWKYPLFGLDGNCLPNVMRWKAYSSEAHPKYLWLGDGERTKYYVLPGLVREISEARGVVIIASGEPDLLTFRAANARNVICGFGEGQIPDTLADDLKLLGVTAVEGYPDLDDTGAAWARKIRRTLAGSGIEVRMYGLPGENGSKRDINRLWMDCAFDEDKFWDALVSCTPLAVEAEPKVDSTLPLITENHELPDGFYSAIAQALGVEGYRADGWSKPVKCPLKAHEHDTGPKTYAAAWNKDKKIFSCLKCGITDMLAKDIGAALGLDWKHYLPLKFAPAAPPRPKAAGQPKVLYTWREGIDRMGSELDGDIASFEPLTLPFKSIAHFGGFARRIEPGKCIAIVGDSGMGKTSVIETVIDAWRKDGFHGVCWSPEWSYVSFVQRAIQRAGGPSYERIEDHKAYQGEVKRGVPTARQTGIPLTEAQLRQTHDIMAKLKLWPGALTYIEKMNIPVEGIIRNMGEVASLYHADGKRLAFAVLDYAQLVNAEGENENARLDRVLDTFKGFCVDKGVVGIVGSQMTKSDGRAAVNGTKAGMHAMVSARSDVFNLVLVLSRAVDEHGETSPLATCRVVKNSVGKIGETQLFLNVERMSWHDVETRREAVPMVGNGRWKDE